MDSEGSALKENEKYLDSIQGRLDQFTNSLQTFWNNILNSDVIKGFVEFGTDAIKFLDTIPGKLTAIATILAGLTKFKGFSIKGAGKTIIAEIQSYQQALYKLSAFKSMNLDVGTVGNFNTEAVNAYAAAVQGLTAKTQAQILASAGLKSAQIQEVMAANGVEEAVIRETLSKKGLADTTKLLHAAKVSEVITTDMAADKDQEAAISAFLAENANKKLSIALLERAVETGALTKEQAAQIASDYALTGANMTLAGSFKAIGHAIGLAFKSNPVGMILTIVTTVVSAIQIFSKFHRSIEEIKEAAEEAVNTFKETQKTLESQKQTIDELAASYQKLSSGVDLNTNENISLTTESYKEYLDVCNDIADMYPNLVVGFDAQGNAILSLKGNVGELIQSYKDAAQAARQQMIASGGDVFKAFKDTYDNDPFWTWNESGKSQQLQIAKKLQELITNNSSKEEVQGFYNQLVRSGYTIGDMTYYKSDLNDMFKSAGIDESDFRSYFSGDIDIEAFRQQSSKLLSFIKSATAQINTETSKVKSLMSAYLGEDSDYTNLSEKSRSYVDQIVSSFDADFINSYDSADALFNYIKTNIVSAFQDPSIVNAVNELSEIQLDFSEGNITYSEYKDQIQTYISQIQDKVDKDTLDQIKIGIGIDEKSLDVAVNRITELLHGKDFVGPLSPDELSKIGSLSAEDLKIASELEVPEDTLLSWDQLIERINKVKTETNTNIISSKTYSELSDMIEKFNDVQKQTEEIVTDNTEVTQEYKNSLIELGISETELSDCFDKNNKLIVTNVSRLKELINKAKTSISTETALARAQARLRYRELYKQLASLTNNRQKDAQANKTQINLLYQEMSAIQKTIAKYSLLEQQLSNVTKTYTEFEEAQSTDSEYDYMSKTESMLVSAIQAYQTGELGTETAQVSIKALVPDVVFEDPDVKTVKDKAAAAHDYIMETLNKYFVLDFDDETGEIQSAEMKMGNLRKFIEDGFENNVFSGTDWQNFEWSGAFLKGLEEAPDKLQYFADEMNVTKEVALAVIQEINNHDIEWLNGDYGSLFDQIIPETLDSKLQATTARIAELNVQLANGKITQEEYTEQVSGLNGQLIKQQTAAVVACNSFKEINDKMDESQKKLEEYQKQLALGTKTDGSELSEEEIQQINEAYSKELQNYETYLQQKQALETKYGPITEYTVGVALEQQGIDVDNIYGKLAEVKALIQETFNSDSFQKVNKELKKTYGIIAKINKKGDVEFNIDGATPEQEDFLDKLGALNDDGTINIDALYDGLTTDQKTEINKLKTLEEKKHLIDYYMSFGGVDTTKTALDDLKTTLDDIYALMAQSPIFKAKVDEDTKSTLDSLLDKIKQWVGEHVASFKATISAVFTGLEVVGDIFDNLFADGTAHVNGTAFKSGSWGAPKTETALVGELGPELLVRNGRWTTIGENGAEFTQVKKGDIIFNHKQTEDLLKNGYVTSRGKAYASGNLGSSDISLGIRDLIAEFAKTFVKITIDNFADKYNKLVNGNVDYHKRPFISPEYMRKSGWEDFDGDVATTFDVDYTVGDSSGKEYMIKVTPILDNGEVLSPEELDEYVSEVLKGADDILSADKDNLVINIAPYVSDDQFSELDEQLGNIKNNHWELVQKYAELSGDSPYTVTSGSSDVFWQSLDKLTEKLYNLKSQMSTDPLGINSENANINTLRSSLQSLGISYDESIGKWFDGKKEFDINVSDLVSTLQEQGWSPEEIQSYCSQLSQADISGVKINVDSKEIDEALAKIQSIPTNVFTTFTTIYKITDSDRYPKYANGTVHLSRNAYSNGNFGAPKTETALVGELGPELLVRNGRWTTIGENGAEFTEIKKGDIIFNHKQTEDLLSNGYVASRGKSYAGGTAYNFNPFESYEKVLSGTQKLITGIENVFAGNINGATFYPDKTVDSQWTGTGYSGPNDTTYDAADALQSAADSLSDSAGSLSDATDEFEEVFDWVEVRLEEIDETLGLLEAKLENAASYSEKRNIIDEMIGVNNTKLENLKAGYKEYSEYADKLLSEIPDQYKEAAKNGAIAIDRFVGEVDKTTLEAIKNYREWGQKAADTLKQIEEVNTTVRDLAIQKIDEAREAGEVRTDVEDSQTQLLQNQVDFTEERGEIADPSYYVAMMENSTKKLEYYTNAYNEMQKEFDKAVKEGKIKKGSNEWYEQVNALYELRDAMDQCNIELEEFQNSINDIYWDKFETYTKEFEYMYEDAQNLIDLMSDADMINKPDNEDGWSANDVQFTNEGLATIGAHAANMEWAEAQVKLYDNAIQNLKEQYAAGLYSDEEFKEKLQELKDGKMDVIKTYKDEKEAIIDVQKQRVEAIQEGIDKEIEAYEELIEKQKESLNAEKDLHDFQRTIAEKTKSIAEIDRKIAALSGDNSASAVAQRRKLMAEKAEAQADLDETYYNRSVSDQGDALDKSLENFKEEKEKEKEEWDKWLEDVEQVIKESLGIVQANATEIGNTLTATAEEFNLTVSDAVLSPWRDGASAISDYDETFGNSVSSMTTRLGFLVEGWNNVSNAILDAAHASRKYYDTYDVLPTSVEDIYKENEKNVAATYVAPKTNDGAKANTNASQPKAPPSVGSTVRVKSSATHFSAQSGNLKMASFVPGGSYQVMQVGVNGDKSQILIGKNGQYTGWVWLKDLEGYAKGTKGVKKDQWAILDELGEELQLVPDGNGRLAYMKKGTSVLNNELTERLMNLAMNPQEMIEQNRPAITPSKSIVNNEINLDCSVGTLVNIEHCDQSTLPDVEKIIKKELDKHMQALNNSLKRYTR